MSCVLRTSALLAICAMPATTDAASRQKPRFQSWTSITDERLGFAIAFPTGLFAQKAPPASEDGRVFVSPDGRAKLLVGAFANPDNLTLSDYREFLLNDEFAGATLDYAPVRNKWFVLSGVRNGEMFYQRVSFTCGGQLINSWAMLYPAAERVAYDRVVEAVARTYMPGAGRNGACD